MDKRSRNLKYSTQYDTEHRLMPCSAKTNLVVLLTVSDFFAVDSFGVSFIPSYRKQLLTGTYDFDFDLFFLDPVLYFQSYFGCNTYPDNLGVCMARSSACHINVAGLC